MNIKMFNKPEPVDPRIIKQAKKDKAIMTVYEFCHLKALLDTERNITRKLPIIYLIIFILIQTINFYISKKEINLFLVISLTPLLGLYIYLIITGGYKLHLNRQLNIFADANKKLYEKDIKEEIDNIIDEMDNK